MTNQEYLNLLLNEKDLIAKSIEENGKLKEAIALTELLDQHHILACFCHTLQNFINTGILRGNDEKLT